MSTFLIVCAFFGGGILLFSLASGAFIFKMIFTRKKNAAVWNSREIEAALQSYERAPNGGTVSPPESVKLQGLSGFQAAHLSDPKIMRPLLQAKLRWALCLEREESITPVSIRVRSTRLCGYLRTPDANGLRRNAYIALIVHGYTDSAAGTAYLAEEYLSGGVAVLAVDCRGHGASGGRFITMGWRDARDIAAWINFLRASYGQEIRIILHGVSMGAAAVIQYGALKKPGKDCGVIAGIVADCAFSSLKDELTLQTSAVFGKKIFQRVIASLSISGASIINALLCGFFLCQNSPKKALRRRRALPIAQKPLILFRGREDALVPSSMSAELVKAASGQNVYYIETPRAPHIGSYFYDPRGYMNAIFSALRVNGY